MKETKSSLKLKNLLLGAASAAALMGSIHSVQAQEAGAGNNEDETEVIEVSGFRDSLTSALNIKRSSKNIIDAINAQDIGKSTDQNIAEALQRVSGISIGREEGEGTTISARGIGGDLNNVTLNGVPLTSSGDSQGVNFSEFSADILQNIEVQKTPSASTDEGSLGATIRLNGFRPLSATRDRRSIELQGRKNNFADKNDHKVTLSLSEKFYDDKIGISFVGTSETQGGRRDRVNHGDWRFRQGFRNGATVNGEIVRAYDVNGDGAIDTDYNGNGEPNQANDGELLAWSPNMTQYRYEQNQRDRDTAQIGLQFKLWEGSDILLSSTFTKQQIGRDQSFIQANNRDNQVIDPRDIVIDPVHRNAYVWIEEAYNNANIPDIPNETRTNLGGQRNVAVWRHGRDVFDDAQESQVHSFDIKQDLGDFSFNLRGGYSNTSQDDEFNIRSFWRAQRQFGQDGNPEPYQSSELRAGTVCENPGGDLRCRIHTELGNPDFVNPIDGSTPFAAQTPLFDLGELFEPQAFSDTRRQSDDTAKSVYLDITWHKELGFFTSFDFGGKWADRDKQVNSLFKSCGVTCLTDQDGNRIIQDLRLQDLSSGMVPSNFIAEQGYARDGQTDGWPIIDIFAVKELIEQGEADGKIQATLNPVAIKRIQQDTWGAYIQGNFEFDDGEIFGDIGLRYAETDVIGTGPSFMQYDANQSFGVVGNTVAISEALGAFYGFFGIDDPNNTITLAEIARLQIERFTPLVGMPAPGGSRTGRTAEFSVNETNAYDNLLPSLNVNWLVNDDVVMRFAASETIARPPFNDLFPRFDVREQIFGERSTGNIGATSLLPFKSQNLDISAEWYFSESSLFSVAIFNKDLKDFTQRNTFDSFYRDVRSTYFDLDNAVLDEERGGIRAIAFTGEEVEANGDVGPGTGFLIPYDASGMAAGCMPNRENGISEGLRATEYCDVAQFTQTENGSGGYVRGLEVSFTHDFSKQLPGIWSGLGLTANYTYADSQADEQIQLAPDGVTVLGILPAAPLANTSEHTYNGTIYWEKGGNLLRLAYSGRSDYLINRVQRDMTRWSEGFDSLDFSAAYNYSKNIRFSFQATNLLDSVTRQYETNRVDRTAGQETLPAESSVLGEQYTGRTVQTWNTGSTYRASVRVNF